MTPLPRPRPPSYVATAGGALFAVAGTLVLGVAACLLSWVPPRGHLMLRLARLWSRGLLASAGVRAEASFEVPLDGEGPYVFLANHQSYFDIPALLPAIPAEIRFAAKRGLFRIPIFGWALAAGGFIPIDRADKRRARRAFAEAARRLSQGISVLFFPEGTRSLDGRLAPFERGGFLLALRSGTPIVPVGIAGARLVQPRGYLAVSPGSIRVRYGAPIDVVAYGVRRRDELIARVRGEIARLAGHSAETGGDC